MADCLPSNLPKGADVIADKGYDANWIRALITKQGCTPVIAPKSNRLQAIKYS